LEKKEAERAVFCFFDFFSKNQKKQMPFLSAPSQQLLVLKAFSKYYSDKFNLLIYKFENWNKICAFPRNDLSL
jgi:hypothetical protein